MHAFMRFNQGLLAMPLHLQAWVLLLISVNLVTPFLFLEHLEAQAVLAAGALGMVLMTALTDVRRWLERIEARPAVQRGLTVPEPRDRKSEPEVKQAVNYARQMLA